MTRHDGPKPPTGDNPAAETLPDAMRMNRRSQKPRVIRRAIWNDAVLAEGAATVRLEGNEYFPAESLHLEHFRATKAHSLCFWNGVASYYDIVVDGVVNPQAAWYYPHPTPFARKIKGHVAFWQGVSIQSLPT